MAKAEQILELLKSHIAGDDARFFAISMQVAAHEAQQGHERLALELKSLIDSGKEKKKTFHASSAVINIIQPKGELANLLSAEYSNIAFSQLTFSSVLKEKFARILLEQQQHKLLAKHQLKPRRKILFFGPPGTGKTITASALASELNIPLFTIRLDGVITKYMGETASKLRLIFDAIKTTRGVYLFDEFDAIGSDRGLTNDVGEARRILNSFLQFMEKDESDSLIIAATNHIKLLDPALFRRFDDAIEYSLPQNEEIVEIVRNRLFSYNLEYTDWHQLISICNGLSHAEITRACDEAAKLSVLSGRGFISSSTLEDAVRERRSATAHHCK